MLALVAVLNDVDWDIPLAAHRLRVTKKTVYARIQRYDVSIPEQYRRTREPSNPSPNQ
jgi:hypothetical protein